MNTLKIILVSTSFVLFSCQKHSNPAQIPHTNKINPSATCVPESDLLSGNIMGGKIVKQSDEDSKMAVMLNSNNHICTAMPIAKRVLLTAAHCIVGSKLNTAVVFHSSVSCESGFNKNEHLKKVSETIVHEKFNDDPSPDKMIADIALVVLEEDIPEGYEIFKIANPKEIEETESDIYLYGYGVSSSNSKDAGVLRKLKLENSLYKITQGEDKIKLSQTSTRGICKGDSGGASYVKIKNEMQILGINSYVEGPTSDICSDKGVQTLVDSYRNWVNDKISEIEKNTH